MTHYLEWKSPMSQLGKIWGENLGKIWGKIWGGTLRGVKFWGVFGGFWKIAGFWGDMNGMWGGIGRKNAPTSD
jgi:hypothetical protein